MMSTSRRADWACYVAGTVPGALLAFAAAAHLVPERVAIALFALSFVGLNLAHMAATWSRVYLTPGGTRSAPVERLYVPALLLVGALCTEALGWGAFLLVVQFYLSLHHATLQTYGIVRSTQRRAGRTIGPRAARLDQAACLLLPMGALTYRARAVCGTYAGAILPPPPLWLAVGSMAAGVVALLAFLAREIVAARRGAPVDALSVAVVLATNLVWTSLLLGIAHPTLPLYALASSHYVQYLYFVWRYEQAKPTLDALPPLVRERMAPPATLGYVIGLTACGGAAVALLTVISIGLRAVASELALRPEAALAIPPWAAAMIGVNLSHYWLDHRIWRSPRGAVTPSPT